MGIRLWLVVLTVLVIALGLEARLGYLYFIERDFLQDQGDARTMRMERINAHRGMIRDRRGRPMAVSSPVISLVANPKKVIANESQLFRLSEHLEIPFDEFRKKIDSAQNRDFVYLRRHMPPQEAEKAISLEVQGVFGQKEYHRYYPTGEVSAHVVGITDIDDRGQEGLELAFDQWLAGSSGKKKVLKNRHGEIIRDLMPVQEAIPGRNLDLSIDLRLQFLAYRELKSAITHYKAVSGSIVILDVQTGQILSMVNQPSYNPNNRVVLDYAALRNRSVTDQFEPGSVSYTHLTLPTNREV